MILTHSSTSRWLALCIALAAFLVPKNSLADAGALDPSFSEDGKATVSFGGVTVTSRDVAVQSDGKTVLIGNTSKGDFAVARLNLDGTPDTTFGPGHNGVVRVHVGDDTAPNVANAVAIQTDGKILVAGKAWNLSLTATRYQMAILRFNTDGSLDKSFDSDGKRMIGMGGFDSEAFDIALQPDGKIVLAGYSHQGYVNINDDFAVARLNSNGSNDSSFGSGGIKYIGFGSQDGALSVAIDTYGTPSTNPRYGYITLAGYQNNATNIPGTNFTFQYIGVARLLPNGLLTSSFGGGTGKVVVSFPGVFTRANAVMIQPSGMAVIAGSRNGQPGGNDFFIARLNNAGQLDASFGGNSLGYLEADFGGNDLAYGITAAPVSGFLVSGIAGGYAVAKYTDDGLPDNAFGINGQTTVQNFGGGTAKIAYGPGRRMTVAGGSAFSVARLFDTGANLVYTASLDPNAAEAGLDPASFFVYRLERLATPTRVYFSVGGTARYPGGVLASARDYSMVGLTTPAPTAGTPYIDIPANATYAVATLNPNDDTLPEPTETATFEIIPNAAYEVGTPSLVTLTIADNDGYVEKTTGANADAYVRDGTYAAQNFGTAGALQAKNGSTSNNRQSYIKFNISSLTSFNSVKLRLYGALSNTTATNVVANIFTVAGTGWSETGITYNSIPANSASAIASLTLIDTTTRFYEVDVTSYIQAEKAAGKSVVSFMIKAGSAVNPNILFNSREAGNGPQLVVI